jgi:processive 1,2-diacylglycerol beta-glucosyltransferase
MRHRILVLTSSTGSGHDMRARAFAQWMARLHPEAVVQIEQIIENASLLGRFGVWLYNLIHRLAPSLHNLYFFIVELVILTQSRTVTFGGTYYRRLLREFHPTHLLSVHDSTNRGYFEDARRILGPSVKCITYCGEFSGGFGYSINWINPSCDLFVARTPKALDYAVKKGIRRSHATVFHKLLPPEAFAPPLSADEIEATRRSLGLDPHRFTLFLTTGGFGANHHLRYLASLSGLIGSIQVIVICGRNARVLKAVQGSLARSGLQGYAEGFSSRIAEFLQISDAVLTRGGANTTMEALHYKCPILYDGLGGLMPQERCTWRYFRDQGAHLLRHPHDLPGVIDQWLRQPNTYQTLKDTLARLNPDESPPDFIERLLH